MKLRILFLLFSLYLLGPVSMSDIVSAQGVIERPKPKQKNKPKPKPRPNKPSASQSRTAILNRLIANMVYVEGGTFTMGATVDQGCDANIDEKPAHQVTLSGFYISKYEVTQVEWQAVMGTNPSYFKGDNHPVEQVSWYDCQEFIRKLNELTGKNFRLPTEAEWEYAARGGNRSYGEKYAGGSDIDNVAWYDGNSNSRTHPVGQKRANELGLFDMSGNVFEWCQDWHGDYSSSNQTNPTGSTTGIKRVLRGGSWKFFAEECRVSDRFPHGTPESCYDCAGFRIACSLR